MAGTLHAMADIHPMQRLLPFLLFCAAGIAHADQTVALSGYLGAASGVATSDANPPFTSNLAGPYAIGVNCPGSFASTPITFRDAGLQATSLGMHPPSSGESHITFNLPAFSAATGELPLTFTSRVGIDMTSLGGAGGGPVRFIVRVDGVEKANVFVGGTSDESKTIQVNVAAGGTLTLVTQNGGSFNSNHGAWGNPSLNLITACPGDFDRNGFVDFEDFDAFVLAFEAGDARSDFNGDNFLDFSDFDDFVHAFEADC